MIKRSTSQTLIHWYTQNFNTGVNTVTSSQNIQRNMIETHFSKLKIKVTFIFSKTSSQEGVQSVNHVICQSSLIQQALSFWLDGTDYFSVLELVERLLLEQKLHEWCQGSSTEPGVTFWTQNIFFPLQSSAALVYTEVFIGSHCKILVNWLKLIKIPIHAVFPILTTTICFMWWTFRSEIAYNHTCTVSTFCM